MARGKKRVRNTAERELYRKVSLRIWGDEKFRALSPLQPSGQALWFFLLTGPFTIRIPGVVLGGPMAMAERLKWPVEGFRAAYAEVLQNELANEDPDVGLIWLPNGIKHNEPESPNVVKGWRKWWPLVPESPLRPLILQGLGSHLMTMGEGYRKAFLKAFPQAFPGGVPKGFAKVSPNQEQEQEQEQDVPKELSLFRGGDALPDPGYSSAGIGVVAASFERVFGKLLAGREAIDVQSWLARGVKPPRFAEAIDAIGRADPSTYRSKWGAVLCLVRDTGPDEPMAWGGPTFTKRGISGADLARLSEELERAPNALANPKKPKEPA